MQGWETGVRTTALELHKQSFFRWTGEVPSPFECPIGAPRALILLGTKNNNMRATEQNLKPENVQDFHSCVVSPAPAQPRAPAAQEADRPSG